MDVLEQGLSDVQISVKSASESCFLVVELAGLFQLCSILRFGRGIGFRCQKDDEVKNQGFSFNVGKEL